MNSTGIGTPILLNTIYYFNGPRADKPRQPKFFWNLDNIMTTDIAGISTMFTKMHNLSKHCQIRNRKSFDRYLDLSPQYCHLVDVILEHPHFYIKIIHMNLTFWCIYLLLFYKIVLVDGYGSYQLILFEDCCQVLI